MSHFHSQSLRISGGIKNDIKRLFRTLLFSFCQQILHGFLETRPLRHGLLGVVDHVDVLVLHQDGAEVQLGNVVEDGRRQRHENQSQKKKSWGEIAVICCPFI